VSAVESALSALRLALLAILAPLALAGCVEAVGEITTDSDPRDRPALREGARVAQATVALVSLSGPPASVSARFLDELARQTAARDIVVVDAKKARYLVEGYLSAARDERGATFSYVWDVFTPDKHRAQRLDDAITVTGSDDDPWAMASDAALASLASRSADDLAAFLSNTPEAALIASGKPQPAPSARTLSFASEK